jgi:glycosyltransferase involved in cell wall biosynthesis
MQFNHSNAPLVTVGIPCYNVERFIGFAIRSVLSQTYTNFELIITDDGSTDGTVEVIKQFNDPRIKLIVDGENRGISYRLNQQIDRARGKYFVRMDGDDIMFLNRIEEQVNYLETHPDVSVVSGQAVIIDDDNRIIGRRGCNTAPRQLTLAMWKSGRTLIHPTVTGRLTYFRTYHYRDEYKGAEDYDLWMRSCAANKIVIMPRPLMFYRDPLTFKLKTYLFRQKQVRKLYKQAKNDGIITSNNYLKSISRSHLRGILAGILSFAKLDTLMIKRRNTPIENKTEYQYILDAQI